MQDNKASVFTDGEIVDFERQAMEDVFAIEAREIEFDGIDMVEKKPLPSTSRVEPHAQSYMPSKELKSGARTIPSTSKFFTRLGKRKM